MRVLVGVSALMAVILTLGPAAAASCAPPAPVAENADRAVAVVHGTVTSAGDGRLTLRVDRVLKGSAAAALEVFVGPGRGGGGGTAVATSVDYAATVGTDHVLYLIRGEDGELETNACIGSHAGPPSGDEASYFGAGTSPRPVSGTAAPGTEAASGLAIPIDPIWLALGAVLVGASAALVLAMRTRARRSPTI